MKTMETVETKKTKHISRWLRRFARTNEAVSALEYALLVGVIAVALSAALVTFSGEIEKALTTIGTEVGSQKIGSVDKLE